MKILLPLFLVIHSFIFSEKVLIITSAYNRADFIEIQHKTFKKVLDDDYEFIVFNDATHKHTKAAIEATCKRLKISCINIPQKIHDIVCQAMISMLHPLEMPT